MQRPVPVEISQEAWYTQFADRKLPIFSFLDYAPYSPEPGLILGIRTAQTYCFGSVELDLSLLYTGQNFARPLETLYAYELTSAEPVLLGEANFKVNQPQSWSLELTTPGYLILYLARDTGSGQAYQSLNFLRSNFLVVYNDLFNISL